MTEREAKVMLGVPGANWCSQFGLSILSLVANSGRPLANYSSLDLGIHSTRGSILPQLRSKLVKASIGSEATHILFLDTDMTFPAWTLHALLERDVDVVAANCPTKMLPNGPTARLAPNALHPAGVPLAIDEDWEEPIRKVWRVGTGIMLIKLEVFKKLQEPYFPVRWDSGTMDYVGEDWGFCEKLEAAGIDIYVDLELSPHVGHVGALEYTHAMGECYNVENQHSIITP